MESATHTQTEKKDKTLLKGTSHDWQTCASTDQMVEEEGDTPQAHIYKLTTENISFFNREKIFVVRKIVKTSNNSYLYWISKEGNDRVIDKRFLRQELFALNDQFSVA